MRTDILAFLLFFLLAGCATIRPCPHLGGREWRELTSPHFIVQTDLDGEAAAATVRRLELYRKVMLLAASEEADPPSRLRVILPSSIGYLRELTGQHQPFWLSFDIEPVMTLSADAFGPRSKELPNALAIRYSQWLTRTTTERVPRWFSQGWAVYLQSAAINDELGVADVGYPLRVLQNLQVHGQGFRKTAAKLEDLWSLDAVKGLAFAQAYEWAYFLRYRHPEGLAAFLDRLSRGEEPRSAWDAVFGHLDPYELEMQAKSFLAPSQSYRYQQIPLPQLEVRITERPLSDPAVHRLRARLRAVLPSEHPVETQRESALAELAGEGMGTGAHALAVARLDPSRLDPAFLMSPPEDPQAQLAWVIAQHAAEDRQAERRSLLERLAVAHPEDALIHLLLARERLLGGEAARAAASAVRSAQLAPWSAAAATAVAVTAAANGQCVAAVRHQRRARELVDDFAAEEVFARANRRLAAFEAGCEQLEPLTAAELTLTWTRVNGTPVTR